MARISTTVSVPSLDEWIGNHGIEEDIFYYLLKLKEENAMYEITLRSNTGNRGRDLMDIPSTSADAGTEPQKNQTSSSYTPSESEDGGGQLKATKWIHVHLVIQAVSVMLMIPSPLKMM